MLCLEKEILQFCENVDSGKIVLDNTPPKKLAKEFMDELENATLEEIANNLLQDLEENVEEIEPLDRAATPEEIAEEERKKNSYFNY